MRSTRQGMKDKRDVERATRDKAETLRTGSRASNARRNASGADETSSEQCATEQKRDGQEVERETRDETEKSRTESRASSARRNGNGTDGKNEREMRLERTLLADNSKTQANNLAVTPKQT